MQSPDSKRIVLYISSSETPRLHAWAESLPNGQKSQIIRNVLAWAIENPIASLADLPEAPHAIAEPKQKPAPARRSAREPKPPQVENNQMSEASPMPEQAPAMDSQLSTDDLAAFNKLWTMGG